MKTILKCFEELAGVEILLESGVHRVFQYSGEQQEIQNGSEIIQVVRVHTRFFSG